MKKILGLILVLGLIIAGVQSTEADSSKGAVVPNQLADPGGGGVVPPDGVAPGGGI